jgi:hypothetical protein
VTSNVNIWYDPSHNVSRPTTFYFMSHGNMTGELRTNDILFCFGFVFGGTDILFPAYLNFDTKHNHPVLTTLDDWFDPSDIVSQPTMLYFSHVQI